MGHVYWTGHGPDWRGLPEEGACPGCLHFKWDAEGVCLRCHPPVVEAPTHKPRPRRRRLSASQQRQAELYYKEQS